MPVLNCERQPFNQNGHRSNSNHITSMAKATRPIPALSEKDKLRFFSKVSQSATSAGCLEWQAGKNPRGYGEINIGGLKYLAHRIAHYLHYREDPCGLCVCHHCDNPMCCNALHLFLGTDADNNADRNRKGRQNPLRGDDHPSRLYPWLRPRGAAHASKTRPETVLRGERHGRAKIRESDVVEIRELIASGVSQRVVAARFGLTQAVISKIALRQTWAHII